MEKKDNEKNFYKEKRTKNSCLTSSFQKKIISLVEKKVNETKKKCFALLTKKSKKKKKKKKFSQKSIINVIVWTLVVKDL